MDYEKSFEIILHAGNAKNMAMEAINEAENSNFKKAYELLDQTNDEILLAHEGHKDLLVKLANGERVDVDLLMVHAEDHLNSATEEILMAKHIVKLYERMGEK